jgi:hypothetical protein
LFFFHTEHRLPAWLASAWDLRIKLGSSLDSLSNLQFLTRPIGNVVCKHLQIFGYFSSTSLLLIDRNGQVGSPPKDRSCFDHHHSLWGKVMYHRLTFHLTFGKAQRDISAEMEAKCQMMSLISRPTPYDEFIWTWASGRNPKICDLEFHPGEFSGIQMRSNKGRVMDSQTKVDTKKSSCRETSNEHDPDRASGIHPMPPGNWREDRFTGCSA